MPQDDQDLIAHLFATTTAVLEDMVEIAVAGQGQLAANEAISTARAIEKQASAVAHLAASIVVVAARQIGK